MDPDHDVLVALDRKDAERVLPSAVVLVGLGLIAGLIAYSTMRLQLDASREIALDVAGLAVVLCTTILLIARRTFSQF